MTTFRRYAVWVAVVITVLGVAVLIAGVCGAINRLGDLKGDHAFQVAGNGRLTDEQAISIARQVLVLDKRDVDHLHLEGDNEHGPTADSLIRHDPTDVTVVYRDARNWIWYVYLRRADGKVVGSSAHGL